MALLNSTAEEPQSRLRRYIVGGVVFLLLIAFGVWYLFRFETEKKTVAALFDALVAGDAERAYQLWKPGPSYTYQDFLEDWGENGYYGPVRSYRIIRADRPRNARGTAVEGSTIVVVMVEISPDAPFPGNDAPPDKLRRIRELSLWVQRSDQSISFSPGI